MKKLINKFWALDLAILRLFRFAIVGGLSSVFYVLLVLGFVAFLGLGNVTSTAVSYVISLLINYILQRVFSFRSTQKIVLELPKFLLLHICNMMVSIAGMYGFVNIWDLPYWIGALFAVFLVPISTFLVMHFWVFGKINHEIRGS